LETNPLFKDRLNRTSDGEVSTSVELKNGHKNLITGERADHQFLTTTADYYKQPDSRPKEAQAGVLTRKRYQDALQEVLDEEVEPTRSKYRTSFIVIFRKQKKCVNRRLLQTYVYSLVNACLLIYHLQSFNLFVETANRMHEPFYKIKKHHGLQSF
jgi:hypothetical protein